MEIKKRILKNVAPEDISGVLEAERETIAQEEERQREIEAYLATLSGHQLHNLKRRAKKASEQALDRANAKKAVPPWVNANGARCSLLLQGKFTWPAFT